MDYFIDEIRRAQKLLEVLQAGTSYLRGLGVEDPRAEADILFSYICGTTRDRLYLQMGNSVTQDQKKRFIEFLQRRGSREPLAYIINKRNFMGYDFYVDQRVLIPRPETELLIEKVLNIYRQKNKNSLKVLDLCTGSGVLAVTLAIYWPEACITATDISKEALAIAKINADKFQVQIDFRQGDLFEPVPGEKFDLIVSNPPYVSEREYKYCSPEVGKEPSLALLAGIDGLEFYRRMADRAQEYLHPEGRIALEIGSGQGLKVMELFREKGFRCTLDSDLAGLDRIVLVEKE